MSFELTILCDNSVQARPGLVGEHGFACHITSGGKNYLFDTGNGLGLLGNAQTCGIDLAALDAVLLSHGHWDHCGGLLPLLRLRNGRPLEVYAHPALFSHRISRRDGEDHDAGPGFTRSEAEALNAVFHLAATPRRIADGITFSGEIPRRYPAAPNDGLFCQCDEDLVPDPLLDDQSLYLEGEHGLTVLCGCAHAGVRNIIAHAFETTGREELYGLIGGLHLTFTESEQHAQIFKDLVQYDIRMLALSHCTGLRAAARLMGLFNERACYAAVGSQLTF